MQTSHDTQSQVRQIPDLPDHTESELGQLRDFIDRWGVMSAVVKTPEGTVIQGRAVSKIAQELGIREIPVIVANVDEDEARRLRIILEAAGRDRSVANGLLDEIIETFPEMTSREIARRFPVVSRSTVDRRRKKRASNGSIVPVARVDPRGYVHKPRPTTILSTSHDVRRISQTLKSISDPPAGLVSRRELRKIANVCDRKAYAEAAPESTPDNITIEACDFRDLAPDAESFDLAVCDPPWGGDWAGRRDEFAAKVVEALKPGGFVVAYTGHSVLPEWLDVYQRAGLTYRWIISVVWSGGSAIRSDGCMSTRFTPVIVCQKGGSWSTPNIVPDLLQDEGGEPDLHNWQQAASPLATLVAKLTRPGARILDLTLGSGTSAVATIQAGEGRSFLGAEIEPFNVQLARGRVAEALRDRIPGTQHAS